MFSVNSHRANGGDEEGRRGPGVFVRGNAHLAQSKLHRIK
jgi:hypothetical protein